MKASLVLFYSIHLTVCNLLISALPQGADCPDQNSGIFDSVSGGESTQEVVSESENVSQNSDNSWGFPSWDSFLPGDAYDANTDSVTLPEPTSDETTPSEPPSNPPSDSDVNFGSTSVTDDIQAPEAAPAPAPPPPAPESPTPSTENLSSEMNTLLQLHNQYRQRHGAPPLSWDAGLAAQSTQYAQGCVWQHSKMSGVGENLYVATESSNIATAAADAWYNEVSLYNFNSPGFSEATGHFTQMVWVSSTSVGCGIVQCPGSMMGWYQTAHYVVCQYSPPGNFEGQYPQNVKPAQ